MKLLRLFQSIPIARIPTFAAGDAIICNGIAFFIDPGDPGVLYAASPSAEDSERRMNLIVAEVIRVLPNFLTDFPQLHPQLRGRKIAVRMISDYSDTHSPFRRQLVLEWDILDAILSDRPGEEPGALS